jgi:hypothetical protein
MAKNKMYKMAKENRGLSCYAPLKGEIVCSSATEEKPRAFYFYNFKMGQPVPGSMGIEPTTRRAEAQATHLTVTPRAQQLLRVEGWGGIYRGKG